MNKPSLTSEPRTGRRISTVWLILIALVVLVLGIGISSSIVLAKATSDFDAKLASFDTNAKAQAQIAAQLDGAKYLIMPSSLEVFADNERVCATTQSLVKNLQNHPAPKIASNSLLTMSSFLSSKYRNAVRAQVNDRIIVHVAVMRNHLERMYHACTVNNTDGDAQKIYMRQADARKALLIPCPEAATGCLPLDQAATYAALYKDIITSSKSQQELYSKQCEYPEQKAECHGLEEYWKLELASANAYYDALISGGDYTAAAQKYKTDFENIALVICRSTASSQPKIYAQSRQAIGKECTDKGVTNIFLNQVLFSLYKADQDAVHSAASIIKG